MANLTPHHQNIAASVRFGSFEKKKENIVSCLKNPAYQKENNWKHGGPATDPLLEKYSGLEITKINVDLGIFRPDNFQIENRNWMK